MVSSRFYDKFCGPSLGVMDSLPSTSLTADTSELPTSTSTPVFSSSRLSEMTKLRLKL